jgi:hypothetical protein
MINSQGLMKGKGMSRSQETNRNDAEALAVAALGFLAADVDRLGRFLAITGLGPENLRQAATDPGFLAGVLAHVADDEPLLVAFAANEGIPPERVSRAHLVLSGAAPHH